MTAITALPAAPSRSDTPADFITNADAFIAALSTLQSEVNVAVLAMSLNATSDTSSSSVAIGTGAKTFTVTAGKSFLGGMWLMIADTAAPSTNWMFGQVTSYSSTSLVMNITAIGGSGTKTAWTISQSAVGILGGGVVAGLGSNTFTGVQNFALGSNIASASTINLTTATGNTVHITGTTTITAVTLGAGMTRHVIFDGALTLTHHATNNKLPGGANITTAAGDSALYVSDGTTVYCAHYSRASGAVIVAEKMVGDVVQVVNTQTGAVATGTTTIPRDDTIPQNTEGDQYMTLAITPTNASNILVIEVVAMFANSAAISVIAALFQDTTANALAATVSQGAGTDAEVNIKITHRMVAGTTSATTFKLRAGGNSAGTLTFNGRSGARLFGGVMASSITITEIKA